MKKKKSKKSNESNFLPLLSMGCLASILIMYFQFGIYNLALFQALFIGGVLLGCVYLLNISKNGSIFGAMVFLLLLFLLSSQIRYNGNESLSDKAIRDLNERKVKWGIPVEP